MSNYELLLGFGYHFVMEGHLALVRQARAGNDFVVASIFVNPAQFSAGEDLGRYPRQLEQDSELLNELGVVRYLQLERPEAVTEVASKSPSQIHPFSHSVATYSTGSSLFTG